MRAIVIFTLFASILLLGTSGIVQQSYAQVDTASSVDLNPPPYIDDECAVGFQYGEGITPTLHRGGVDCSEGELTDEPAQWCGVTDQAQSQLEIGDDECLFFVPNFDDPFDTKLIRIQAAGSDMETVTVEVEPSSGNCELVNRDDDGIPNRYFLEDWICHPNPSNENVFFSFGPDTRIDEVLIDSVSFEEPLVGGEFIEVDSTALLLAGAQMNAAWMIPVIVSGIGIAIVIAIKF